MRIAEDVIVVRSGLRGRQEFDVLIVEEHILTIAAMIDAVGAVAARHIRGHREMFALLILLQFVGPLAVIAITQREAVAA